MQLNIIWNDERVNWQALEKNGFLFKSLVFTDRRNNSADDVTLEFADMTGAFRNQLIPQKTDKIQFELLQGGHRLNTPTFYVDGTNWDVRNNTVSIKGLNINYLKNNSFWKKRNQTYKNTTLRQVISGVAQRNNYDLIWFGDDFSIPYVSQIGISDYVFIKTIATRRGDFFKILKGKNLVYGSTTEQTVYSRADNTTTVNRGVGARLINLRTTDFSTQTLTSTTNKKTKFQLETFDQFKRRFTQITGDFSSDFDFGFNESKDYILNTEQSVKGNIGNTVLSELTAKGTIPISRDNKFQASEMLSGSVVYLADNFRLSGTYIIESVTHRFTPGGWIVDLDMARITANQLKLPTVSQRTANRRNNPRPVILKGKTKNYIFD